MSQKSISIELIKLVAGGLGELNDLGDRVQGVKKGIEEWLTYVSK
jgi:hypothetical protein